VERPGWAGDRLANTINFYRRSHQRPIADGINRDSVDATVWSRCRRCGRRGSCRRCGRTRTAGDGNRATEDGDERSHVHARWRHRDLKAKAEGWRRRFAEPDGPVRRTRGRATVREAPSPNQVNSAKTTVSETTVVGVSHRLTVCVRGSGTFGTGQD